MRDRVLGVMLIGMRWVESSAKEHNNERSGISEKTKRAEGRMGLLGTKSSRLY